MTFCGVCCSYSSFPFKFSTLVEMFFVNNSFWSTSLWFARYIQSYVIEHTRANFIFSKCMQPICIKINKFGRSRKEKLPKFCSFFKVAVPSVPDVVNLWCHGFCCVPLPNRCTVDYSCLACWEMRYERLDGWFLRTGAHCLAVARLLFLN